VASWSSARTICFVLYLADSGLAQVSNSRLEGMVTDPAGKAVSAAVVVAVNDTKGLRSSAATDEQGSYAFLSLPAGEYTVTVEAPGFRKAVLSGVILRVGVAATASAVLELGPVTEIVTVRARHTWAPADPQAGFAITLRDVEALPQLERYPIALALFIRACRSRAATSSTPELTGRGEAAT
jgi:hypothetical protein